MREKQSYSDYIETLTLEKDEMIRAHTIETGELRKKISVLRDHVHRYETQSMASAVLLPVNHGFAGGYDVDDMTMTGTWDHANFLNDYAAVEPPMKPQMAIVPAKKSDNTVVSDGDKGTPHQGGLLFILFLVGAFFMSSRSTPAIPRVSEDVRAASAILLDNVLKDAGVNLAAPGLATNGPSALGDQLVTTNPQRPHARHERRPVGARRARRRLDATDGGADQRAGPLLVGGSVQRRRQSGLPPALTPTINQPWPQEPGRGSCIDASCQQADGGR